MRPYYFPTSLFVLKRSLEASWNPFSFPFGVFCFCFRWRVDREGAWDKAARDPNDEMVQAGLTPDNIRKWEYLKGIQGQNETVGGVRACVRVCFVFTSIARAMYVAV